MLLFLFTIKSILILLVLYIIGKNMKTNGNSYDHLEIMRAVGQPKLNYDLERCKFIDFETSQLEKFRIGTSVDNTKFCFTNQVSYLLTIKLFYF